MTLIRIPQKFYIDHEERDLPCPEVVKFNKRHYWIRLEDEHTSELLSDAEFYSDCAGFGWDMGDYGIGLQSSAQATAKAIRKAGGKV